MIRLAVGKITSRVNSRRDLLPALLDKPVRNVGQRMARLSAFDSLLCVISHDVVDDLVTMPASDDIGALHKINDLVCTFANGCLR